MDKLKAFTLLEMLVVLIISSLLIILSTGVLLNFNRYYEKTITDQNSVNEIFLFSINIRGDFDKADYITGNSEVLRFYLDNHVKTYEIYSDKIIINTTNKADTLHLRINDLNVNYITDGIVNYIEMRISENGQSYTINQYKEYSSCYLFDQRRNHL